MYTLSTGEKISINGLQQIASGKTGNVFRYKNSALKIFSKDCPMDEETANTLRKIGTSRILLPIDLLYCNGKLKGYTYKLVQGVPKKFITTPKENLIGSIRLVEEDIRLLSKKRVLLTGLTKDNYIFNGELYISDPSQYSILGEEEYPYSLHSTDENDSIARINSEAFYYLLYWEILREINGLNGLTNDFKNQIKALLGLKNDIDQPDKSNADFFDEIIGPNKDIRQLVYRMSDKTGR